jgi:quercetin dioxygenase-like cupin family protein
MKKWVHLGIGLVVGASVGTMSGKTTSQDPVQVSPQFYKVRFENDRVRVLEYRLPPGQKEAMHSHPQRVGYELSDSTVRLTTPDGKSTEETGKSGEVFWGEAESHAVQNLGKGDVHVLAVELKPCGN